MAVAARMTLGVVLAALVLAGCGAPGSEAPSPSFPGSMGATPWRSADDVREEFAGAGETHATPGALLTELAAFLRPRIEASTASTQTAEVGESEATGRVLLSGVPDDSIAGEEYRVTMRGAADGWSIESLEVRTHCRRGVSGDLCV